MPSFSFRSVQQLSNRVHPDLIRLFQSVILDYDCTVIGGIRTVAEQRSNMAKGLSRTMVSKHLPQADGLAHAVDVAPYPMPDNWDDEKAKLELVYFAGKVMERARQLGISIRYGGDWNQNDRIADNGFMDLDHFELVTK